MDIMLNVKNLSKIAKPNVNDVIVYDGKKWYVTTKKDILEETYEILNLAIEQNRQNKEEIENFKKNIAEQLLKMAELIENLYDTGTKK